MNQKIYESALISIINETWSDSARQAAAAARRRSYPAKIHTKAEADAKIAGIVNRNALKGIKTTVSTLSTSPTRSDGSHTLPLSTSTPGTGTSTKRHWWRTQKPKSLRSYNIRDKQTGKMVDRNGNRPPGFRY